jgi:hypothetical protein
VLAIKKYLIITVLLFSTASLAVETSSTAEVCTDLKDIEAIKKFLICQSTPGVFACTMAGLGAGAMARYVAQVAATRGTKLVLSLEKKIISELAEQLHDEVRERIALRTLEERKDYFRLKKAELEAQKKVGGLNVERLQIEVDNLSRKIFILDEPLYKPDIRYVNDRPQPLVDVANTPFKDLPPEFKAQYLETAEDAIRAVEGQGKGSFRLSEYSLNKAAEDFFNLQKKRQIIEDPLHPSAKELPPLAMERNKSVVSKALVKIQMELGKSARNLGQNLGKQALRESLQAALRVAGRESFLMAGRVLSVGLFVGAEALAATPTGCDELGDFNISIDSNCKFVYEVNDRVLKFLEAPEAEQKMALSIPKVCEFYKGLKRQLIGTHTIDKIVCRKDGYDFSTISRGQKHTHSVTYDSNGEIRKVRMGTPTGARNSNVDEFIISGGEITSEIPRGGGQSLTRAQAGLDLKMYLPLSQSCCLAPRDESLAHLCGGGAPLVIDGDTVTQ